MVVLQVIPAVEDVPAMISFSSLKYKGLEFGSVNAMATNGVAELSGDDVLNLMNEQLSSNIIETGNEPELGGFDKDNNESADALLVPTSSSLSFEDEIRYNIYFTVDGLTDFNTAEMGLITFGSKLNDGTIADAVDVIPGASFNGSEYMVHTNGIPAKNMGDTLYFKVYAKLSDGSYVYSDVYGYSALAYAKNRLANSQDDSLKSLVVAMLNYGAAAQMYFGYNTDALMNADLTADQLALAGAYDAAMMEDISSADAAKTGNFAMTEGSFLSVQPSVSFEGAFSVNFYYEPGFAVDGETPDIIAIYLGTNDCNSLTSTDTLGTPSDSMYNTVTKLLNNTSYAPSTILGAYSLMIARAKDEYPNAEIYCFTLLHKIYDGSDANDAVYEAFNAGVKTIADHYGCYVVDLYNESGIHEEKLYQEYCLMTDPVNSLHPYPAGMDAITNCFISSMMKNSQYMTGTTRYSVRYDLTNTYVQVGNMFGQREMFGDVTTAMAGKPFQVELGTAGVANIDVTVTMGGVDITQEVVHGDVITIDSVTGDIVITATEFDNFYWYADTSDYISKPDFDATFSYNDAAQIRGTYNTNGVFGYGTGCSFKLSEPAMLLHDRPWILEFKATGVPAADYPDEGFKGGILLTSDSAASDVNGNTYIHLNQSQLLLGHRDSGYNNTGYGWDQIAAKVGSSSGDLFRNETHVYRLENKVNADGTNMVYLTVDGTLIGAMNKGEATASEISGRDYMINYLGTSSHPLLS